MSEAEFGSCSTEPAGALTGLARQDIEGYRREHGGVPVRLALQLRPPFRRISATAWAVDLKQAERWGDDVREHRSTLVLLENGRLLGPPHAPHDQIGQGAYSHWGHQLIFSSSDGSDPNQSHRYVVLVPVTAFEQREADEVVLTRPFTRAGDHLWVAPLGGGATLSDVSGHRRSFLTLTEDGTRIGPAHAFHERISSDGGGLYSHWGDRIFFSTSDNSDPNYNGRRYSLSWSRKSDQAKEEYLDLWYRKRETYSSSPTSLWGFHPEANWFLEAGGRSIPPPIYANLVGLTSFCNLHCTICGSQEAIDHEKVRRRSMSPEVLSAVSDTIFPNLLVLILASLGEPTIYPHFNQVLEAALRWGVSIKLESNATALTQRMIELLTSVRGELFFSIDATEKLFEQVRVGASWSKVDSNIRQLMARKDPQLTKVNLYPTISRRTLPDMINVAKWGLDVGVEEISFHSYDPTMFAKEERPEPAEFEAQKEMIQEWLEGESASRDVSAFSVKVNGIEINIRYRPVEYPLRPLPKNHPVSESEYEASEWKCSTPRQNVDIGPDGQIYPCVWSGARPQDNTMGLATSKEEFARAWFGERYVELREALRVDSNATPNVEQCLTCLKRYA